MAWQAVIDVCSGLMAWCRSWCPNDWCAVLAFTAVTKVVLMPLSLWCHVNGLRMVALMARCNRLRIRLDGDGEAYANETAALFRRVHYRPLLALVPVAAQLVLLMVCVEVIGSQVHVTPTLGKVPVRDGGMAWAMPFVAGAAAWLFGFCQNRINPLQREQSHRQQAVTNGISIAISLGLGCFVAAGVGFYWAASNLLSIAVQLFANLCLPPKNYVNYSALRQSQAELARFEAALKAGAEKVCKEDRRRERADYRRFFSVVNKHLVFYAESGGFYKYFKPVIEWLLEHSNAVIHYVTNDPKDAIFDRAGREGRIRAYYIGQRRIIPLMMKMDAEMVVMTTPDLGTYHLKRSYVKKDVEYVYIDHGTSSMSMQFRKGAFDHFDTIFMSGPFLIEEFRKTEELYGTKRKTLVPTGYAYLGDLMKRHAAAPGKPCGQILIAPSYQSGNILESCLEEMLVSLANVPEMRVVLRPHPQFVRRNPAKWQTIRARAAAVRGCQGLADGSIVIDDDFSKSATLEDADIVITDWSSIAYEFSLVTKRPSVLVNTPMKAINPEYGKLGIEPTDITFRDCIGRSLEVADVPRISDVVTEMIAHPEAFAAKIDELLANEFYDPLKAGEVAGSYILDALIAKGEKSGIHGGSDYP